jgi:hypothetical protein
MGLFDLFRKPSPIRDAAGLSVFVEAETAFLVQKSTWEYSRARSGVLWQKLFKEEAFKAAIEASTWGNFPLGLAFVGEMTVTTLRNGTAIDAGAAASAVAALCRDVIDRQPQPRGFPDTFWPDARAFVTARIERTVLAPPKAVKDIPLDGHADFFARLPMHPDLTRHDRQLLQNTLRVHLCRAHEALLARLDTASLVPALERAASPGPG